MQGNTCTQDLSNLQAAQTNVHTDTSYMFDMSFLSHHLCFTNTIHSVVMCRPPLNKSRPDMSCCTPV